MLYAGSFGARRLLKVAKIQILRHRIIFFIFANTDRCIMISNSKSKLIRSLRQKKYRDQHGQFLVEGEKMVEELISGGSDSRFHVNELFATPEWINKQDTWLQKREAVVNEASKVEIKKLSNLVSPQAVIALVSIPQEKFRAEELLNTPVLAFESIRDPGNLGTIIRTADWFGIRHIVCSPDSADLYNPKVVQSTMGAIARVKVHYQDLEVLLESGSMKGKTVFGTYMEGDNIYESSLGKDPLILFGNESRGLSAGISSLIQNRISIPSFSPEGGGSESLNVASAVAVICSELIRR